MNLHDCYGEQQKQSCGVWFFFIKNIMCLLCFLVHSVWASPIVNVYAWGGEIPKQALQQFEKETGIHVNFSTYDSNETLYAKLKANPSSIYDVILPSSYYVERMKKQDMLLALNHHRLPQLTNLDPQFNNNEYDPNNQYSIPLLWGATGIFYNRLQVTAPPKHWSQLWQADFKNKLLLLDDSREIFSIALLSLGYPPNDGNPQHIKQAYHRLRSLVPNIKLFSTEGIQAILIDEDATAGIVWSGDASKAHDENDAIAFHYPDEGYVLWVDCLAIPKNAKHIDEAYAFINFMLTPKIAAMVGSTQGYALTNAAGKALLPLAIQNNPMIYPPKATLSHAYVQRDPGEETIALFNQYWQALKLLF